MTNQDNRMSHEELQVTLINLKKKLQDTEDQLLKTQDEKDGLKRGLDSCYDELEGKRGRVKSKRKNGGKSSDDNVRVEMGKLVSLTMILVFRHYKFSKKTTLLKYSEDTDGTLCSRVRSSFEHAGLPFNKGIWISNVCDVIVTWLVSERAKYVTNVRKAYFGEFDDNF